MVAAESRLDVDDVLLSRLKITRAEYARIVDLLGRAPNLVELGAFSAMWSEHCSYKSSRLHLERLPSEGKSVLQGPGENAGAIDIGDGFAVVFKIESHNHPSFIEPKQGAATGLGGILRDIFAMGARPVATLDSLRFGSEKHPRTRALLHGVVRGIGGYGNAFGVPNVGGEVQFDARYDGNILVNAFACGVIESDRLVFGRASGVGNAILTLGAKTGRDGIHGATMASDSFGKGKSAARGAIQVGDPFRGKMLMEACLELRSLGLALGIQDMGAAGLTSSSVEMGARSKTGIDIDLDLVPRRAKAMSPLELLLSESQERMLLVVRPELVEKVVAVATKWELDCATVGRVTDTTRWVIRATQGYDPLSPSPIARDAQIVCDLPLRALTEDAPRYERPMRVPSPSSTIAPRTAPPPLAVLCERAFRLLRQPNVGSKAWVYRQYDQIVRGGTVQRPGCSAGVIRVPCERDGVAFEKFLAFSVDGNGRFVDLDAHAGSAMAVAEATRNLVVAGARPIGLTDGLNFGSPENPETMFALSQCIDGIAEACGALAIPVVSGNVSLYNETDGRPILPTPIVAAVGLVDDIANVTTPSWKNEGDIIVLLGAGAWDGLRGSEYEALFSTGAQELPVIDLTAERALQDFVRAEIKRGSLVSANDVADGGLLTTLLEGSLLRDEHASPFGAAVELPNEDLEAFLFGESSSRIVVSVAPAQFDHLLARARSGDVLLRVLGHVTTDDTVRLTHEKASATISVALARSAHANAFAELG